MTWHTFSIFVVRVSHQKFIFEWERKWVRKWFNCILLLTCEYDSIFSSLRCHSRSDNVWTFIWVNICSMPQSTIRDSISRFGCFTFAVFITVTMGYAVGVCKAMSIIFQFPIKPLFLVARLQWNKINLISSLNHTCARCSLIRLLLSFPSCSTYECKSIMF